MIKMIVSDIDGTIVEEGCSKIKQEYFNIINKLVDDNYVFAIASGRNITEIDAAFNRIKERAYFIANNGGTVSKGNNILVKNFFNKDDITEFLQFLDQDQFIKNYVSLASSITEGVYVKTKDEDIAHMLENTYGAKVILVNNFYDIIPTLLKINIFVKDEKALDVYKYIKERYAQKFSILVSGKHWVDICDKKTSKGNAVEFIQKMENIKKSETVVLGDNINDIDMLCKGKYSFVPIISSEEVKNHAKYIMPSYKDDGALQVFETVYEYGHGTKKDKTNK